MRYPLSLDIRPSKGAMASVLALHLLAGLALFHMRFPADWMLPPACVLLLASAGTGLHMELRKRCLLILDGDGGVTVRTDGNACAARIEAGAVDFGWVIWLRLRGQEEERLPRHLRSLMLLPVHVADGHWRLLRIWLRHRALRSHPAEV